MGLLLMNSQGLQAQSSHQLSIHLGYAHTLTADRHTSPLLYQAHTATIGLRHQYQGSYLLETSLHLRIGSNQSRRYGKRIATISDPANIYGEAESYEVEANPNLSMLDGSLQVLLAWSMGRAHYLGMVLNGRHILSGMGADTWLFTQVSLGPVYQYTLATRLLTYRLRIGLPVLSYVVRPNFSRDAALPEVISYWWGYVQTNSRIAAGYKLFAPTLELGTSWPLANGDALGFTYVANWSSYPSPRPMRMLTQSLDLSYSF